MGPLGCQLLGRLGDLVELEAEQSSSIRESSSSLTVGSAGSEAGGRFWSVMRGLSSWPGPRLCPQRGGRFLC